MDQHDDDDDDDEDDDDFYQQKTAQRPSSRANGFLNGSSYFKASSSFFS